MRLAKFSGIIAAAAFAVLAATGAAAQALKVGDQAPAFSLPATIGKQASSTSFPGKTLMLFFYNAAFTNT